MVRIGRVLVVGGLSTSVLAAFVAVGSSAPAQAGAGTSQTVSSVLDMQVAVQGQNQTVCLPGGAGCKDVTTDPATFTGMAISFGYDYTPGRANSAPDVLSWTGRLPAELPASIERCENRFGVAIWVSGANLTGSRVEFKKDGKHWNPSDPTATAPPSPSTSGIQGDGVAYCIDRAPITIG